MEFIRRNTDYAIRALAHLAAKEEVVAAADIAEQEEIPLDFLHKIMRKLVRAGYVESFMGPTGGFALAVEPGGITLLNAVELLQGPVTMNRCALEHDRCPMSDACVLKGTWSDLESKVVDYLDGVSLQDVVSRLRAHRPGESVVD